MDGSHLYNPTTDIDDVIIPTEIKKSVLDIVQNYEVYKKAINILEIDKKLSYGLGITLLFSGESGTGKTALANSIGKLLKKKILLVNFPNLGNALHTHSVTHSCLLTQSLSHSCLLTQSLSQSCLLTYLLMLTNSCSLTHSPTHTHSLARSLLTRCQFSRLLRQNDLPRSKNPQFNSIFR